MNETRLGPETGRTSRFPDLFGIQPPVIAERVAFRTTNPGGGQV